MTVRSRSIALSNRRALRGAALCLAGLAAGMGPALWAQQDARESPVATEFRERVDVELVNVDVWVTDREGDPVPGLTVGDFEVLHDGEPVPVAHFVEIRNGAAFRDPEAAPGGAEPAEGAAAPSHLIVYVDHSRLHPTHLEPLTTALDDLMTSGAVAPERVLVLRQGRSLSVEVPFGSTPEQLSEGLDRLRRGGGTGGVDIESEVRLALDEINRSWEESQDLEASAAGGLALVPDNANPTGQPGGGGSSPRSVVGGVGGGGGPDACGMFVNQVRPTLDSWARSRAYRLELTLSNLSDSIGFLAGLPGVKMLLYLSDGLETQPGTALFTYASSLCPAAGADLLSGSWTEEASARVEELTRHANANRVTIHALQASGLTSSDSSSSASGRGSRGGASQRSAGIFEATRRSEQREGMDLIARQTGGRAIFGRNDLGPELAKIGEASRSYYSLAYQPPAGDGPSHRIDVKLSDAGLDASFRRGYREKSSEQQLGERVEGAMNLGITDNPLEVRLGAGETQAADDGKLRVPVHVLLPLERLTFLPRDGGDWIAEVTVKVMARGLDGGLLAVRDQTFRLKGAPGASGPIGLPVIVELEAGSYLTAVGVRDEGSQLMSYISTTLEAGPGG